MELTRLQDVSNPYWKQTWEIYEQSFPIFETRRLEDQIQAMDEEAYHCMVATKEDIVLGLIFYWEWEESIYIEHFAINPDFRGQNYGTSILRGFIESTQKVVILEIDPPVDDISCRRLAFYEQLGFKMNDYDYSHPPYRKSYTSHTLRILSHGQTLNEEVYHTFRENVVIRAMEYVEK